MILSAVTSADDWPPKEPNAYASVEDDENHILELPSTPWTYDNGDLNPHLQPPSMRRRLTSPTKRHNGSLKKKNRISAVPPYHPDYRPPGEDEDFPDSISSGSSADEEVQRHQPHRFIRRGSEGYEVHAIDREDMLRQHVVSQITEPGRYNVYVPDPSSESDEEQEETPLASKVQNWRAETTFA